jgi:hypothetical protein
MVEAAFLFLFLSVVIALIWAKTQVKKGRR